jgi:hypothetical protein
MVKGEKLRIKGSCVDMHAIQSVHYPNGSFVSTAHDEAIYEKQTIHTDAAFLFRKIAL